MARKVKKNIVVIYHGNCTDGFGGAWAAWKKFGNRATYFGAEHNTDPPPGLKNKEIYLVDFSYPIEIVKKLIKSNLRVTSIDHHISAEPATKITKDYAYALDHSGAVLAWKYFHPHKKIPQLLKHVEDIDLWKFKIPKTKEIMSYVSLFKLDFKLWNKIASQVENAKSRKRIIENGSIVLNYIEKLANRLVTSNAEKVKFEGYKVFAVNSPLFVSQVGHKLVKKLPPFAIVWRKQNGRIEVSLRSNGSVDVSKIAQKYGGGGHKEAAGFSFKTKLKFPWKPIKK